MNRSRTSLRRRMGGASLLALSFGLAAAGDALAQQAASGTAVSEVVITGSRIVANGFTAPTPVSVVSAERLQERAATNVGDVLNELPAFRGTQTPAAQGLTGGYVGGRVLDLRGLGPVRTLTLVDGQRFVPSTTQGTVDTNMIPSILVERVDVVTGGASAQYGSDAVAGVVNFIMNKRLSGIRANASYGASTHGDDIVYSLGLAGGTDLLGGRAHAVFGAEYEKDSGVGTCTERDWCAEEWLNFGRPPGVTNIPANNILPNVHPSTIAPNGVINNTILRGISFNNDGTPRHFQYGNPVNSLFMVGGEGHGVDGYFEGIPIKSPTERAVAYGHVEGKVTDAVNVALDLTLGHLIGWHASPEFRSTALTIKRDNPFIPSSSDPTLDVRGILDANPTIASFQLGKHFMDIGNPEITSRDNVFRAALSFDGRLSSKWTWDAYYQYGRNSFRTDVINGMVVPRVNNAVDAVRNGSGQIVCRINADSNPNNDDPACAPLNPFGQQISAAARGYVVAPAFQTNITTEHVVAGNLHGSLLDLWAGPLAVAAGGEFRSDRIAGAADAISQALGFQANNGQNISGQVKVTEGYVEGALPLAHDAPLLQTLEANGAIRRTHYSREGAGHSSTVDVTTWKVGGVWQPVEQVRFRLTRSRDIRAPNVSELFGPNTTGFGILNDPARGGLQTNPVVVSGSNPNLVPEVADTWTYGVVFRPTWGGFSRFGASIDRFDITLRDAIGTLGAQTIATRCFQGAAEDCALITRDSGGVITQINDTLANVNQLTAVGYDFELNYRQPLGSFGDADFRLFGSYYEHLVTVDSAGKTDRADQTGVRGGTLPGIPRYTLDGLVHWKRKALSVDVHLRYIPPGRYNALFIGPDEPGYSIALPNSSNTNHVPGAFYADVLAQYEITRGSQTWTAFAGVNNIADKDPPRVPGANGSGSSVTFDPVGRTFKVGVRFRQ